MKNSIINLGFQRLGFEFYLKWPSMMGLATALMLITPAHACYDIPPPVVLDTSMMMFNTTNYSYRLMMMDPHTKKKAGAKHGTTHGVDFSKETIANGESNVKNTAHALAEKMPAAQRKEIELAFLDAFTVYQKLEKQLNIPKNDIAGALTAFLVGNYEAYHNTQLAESHTRQIVRQMRGAIMTNPALKTSDASRKREFYEKMAMVGTFMILAQAEIKKANNLPML